jgi:hypothetical protein
LHRTQLTDEAIRLTRQVWGLLPSDGEVAGLLALMLLTDARRPSRRRALGFCCHKLVSSWVFFSETGLYAVLFYDETRAAMLLTVEQPRVDHHPRAGADEQTAH